MASLQVTTFNLDYTLNSGQLFRFFKRGDVYYVVVGETLFKVKQENNLKNNEDNTILYFDNISQEALVTLFSLDKNYAMIYREIGKDPFMEGLIQRYHGLRVIHHDPWECLVSFICASFSNIQKIRYSLDELSRHFGKLLTLDEVTTHRFPPWKSLTNKRALLKARTGFRARYLYMTNRKLTPSFFDEVKQLPYQEAKNRLMEFDGIGEKVADCILLFSLGFYEAFPVDVWIKRIMEQEYLHKPTPGKKIAEFGRNYFGRYAGIAQQYLYFHALMKKQGR